MERLDPGVKRLMNPHIYHVSLSEKMWQMKQKLIAAMRAGTARQGRRTIRWFRLRADDFK